VVDVACAEAGDFCFGEIARDGGDDHGTGEKTGGNERSSHRPAPWARPRSLQINERANYSSSSLALS
jgi:hypothetical protein